MAATASPPSPCPTCKAACPSTWATASSWRRREESRRSPSPCSQIAAHTHPLLGSASVATDVNPGNRVVAQSGSAGALSYVEDVPNAEHVGPRPSPRSAAASRTPTCSPTCASASSSPSSGSSRRQHRRLPMADPFVAEIRIFPFNFAPTGWAFCDGQLLPLSQNTALFSLLGTTYGGDGKSNFALPNLQGQRPAPPGPGSRAEPLRPGTDRRLGHRHPAGVGDPQPQPRPARLEPAGRLPGATRTTRWRASPMPTRAPRPGSSRWPLNRSPRPAGASRTTT